MRIYLGVVAITLLMGAGCMTITTQTRRCFAVDNDPGNTLLTLAYDATATQDGYGDIPATLTITDASSEDAQAIPGSLRNGMRFVYPTGDYFEIVADKLIGHEPNLREGFAAMIDGIVATETTCGE